MSAPTQTHKLACKVILLALMHAENCTCEQRCLASSMCERQLGLVHQQAGTRQGQQLHAAAQARAHLEAAGPDLPHGPLMPWLQNMEQQLRSCTAQVAVQRSSFPIIYKYAISGSQGQLELEPGENRLISSPGSTEEGRPLLLAQQDGHFR